MHSHANATRRAPTATPRITGWAVLKPAVRSPRRTVHPLNSFTCPLSPRGAAPWRWPVSGRSRARRHAALGRRPARRPCPGRLCRADARGGSRPARRSCAGGRRGKGRRSVRPPCRGPCPCAGRGPRSPAQRRQGDRDIPRRAWRRTTWHAGRLRPGTAHTGSLMRYPGPDPGGGCSTPDRRGGSDRSGR